MAEIDLVTLAALLQTIVLTVTMVLLIVQFRSQERAVKEAAYQRVLDDYNDTVRGLVEHPELSALLDDMARMAPRPSPEGSMSPEDRIVRSHMLVVYGLLERVYVLYARGWIDDDTWKQWEAWLAVSAENPFFRQIHARSQGMFDRAFQDHVARFVTDVPTKIPRDEPPGT
jgi:hypothetical protein